MSIIFSFFLIILGIVTCAPSVATSLKDITLYVGKNVSFHVSDSHFTPQSGDVKLDFLNLPLFLSSRRNYASAEKLDTFPGIDYSGSMLRGNVFVDGDYAYCSGLDRVYILNIKDLKNISQISNVQMAPKCQGTRQIVHNNRMYVINDWTTNGFHGLTVVDVTDPLNTRILSRRNITVVGGNPNDLTIAFPYLYIVKTFGSVIYDVSDSLNPVVVSYLKKKSSDHYMPWSVEVQGNRAYVAEYEEYGFSILDITDKNNPKIIGQWTDGDKPRLDYPIEVFPDPIGETVFLIDDSNRNLFVFNVKNESKPELRSTVYMDYAGEDMVFDFKNKYAYVSSSAVIVIDIEDFDNLKQISKFAKGVYHGSIFKVEDVVYLFSNRKGVSSYKLKFEGNNVTSGATLKTDNCGKYEVTVRATDGSSGHIDQKFNVKVVRNDCQESEIGTTVCCPSKATPTKTDDSDFEGGAVRADQFSIFCTLFICFFSFFIF